MLDIAKVTEVQTTLKEGAARGLFEDSPNDWMKRAEKRPDGELFVYVYNDGTGYPAVLMYVDGEPAIFGTVIEMLDRTDWDVARCPVWIL